MRTGAFRVLVVEDDPQWREILVKFYERLFAGEKPDVQTAPGAQALRRLGRERFDLLSLDINLAGDHPKNASGQPDLDQPGASGLEVLDKASVEGACGGVVLITGANADHQLSMVIREEDNRRVVRTALSDHLQRLFPDRYLLLWKEGDCSPQSSLQFWESRGILSKGALAKMCVPGNRFARENIDVWCISFDWKSVRLKHSVGFLYLAQLLAHPTEGISVLDLRSQMEADRPDSGPLEPALLNERSGRVAGGRANKDEISDSKAQAAYKKRRDEIEKELGKLQKELDELEHGADPFGEREQICKRLACLEKEKALLVQAIQGSQRKFVAPELERARHAVSKAITRAVEKLEEYHPALHRHLTKSLQSVSGYTPAYCPGRPISWEI